MKLAIQDANILIDCAKIGLADEVFSLDYEFWTTDLVWSEITSPKEQACYQPHIDCGNLHVVSFGY